MTLRKTYSDYLPVPNSNGWQQAVLAWGRLLASSSELALVEADIHTWHQQPDEMEADFQHELDHLVEMKALGSTARKDARIAALQRKLSEERCAERREFFKTLRRATVLRHRHRREDYRLELNRILGLPETTDLPL